MRGWAVAIGVGHASHEECDELGMTAALRAAGHRALAQLDEQGFVPDRVVLDGNHDYLGLGARVTTVIKGDATCLAVAAASCVAKVTRDRMMVEEAEHFPPYGFESNVGYPAPVHKAALARLRPERDPPPVVDLHGGPVLARARRPRRAGLFADSASDRRTRMDVDLPEVHARALDATRVIVAGVGDDQWDAMSGLRRTGPCASCVNHIVTRELLGAPSSPAARRSTRSATASTVTCSAPTRSPRTTLVGGRGRRRSARPARWTRRARCRTGRCRARSTAATGSWTC